MEGSGKRRCGGEKGQQGDREVVAEQDNEKSSERIKRWEGNERQGKSGGREKDTQRE